MRITKFDISVEDVMTYGLDLSQHQKNLLIGATVGHNYDELSNEFGVPVGTIKSRLSRARVKVLNAKQAANVQAPQVQG